MQSELKPCPFCGSDKHTLLSPTCDRSSPYNPADRAFPVIRCSGCYTDVPGRDFDASGKSAVEAWNRRAALSAEQKQPVAVKPLEWRREAPYHVARVFGNVYAVEAWDGGVTLSGIPGHRDFKTVEAAKAAAQSDYEQRIRSALVDVPAVEPVAHIIEGLNGEDPRVYLTQKYDPRSPDFWLNEEARAKHRVTPLYTYPPLFREGEDSAEVVEEGAKILAKWIGYAWDGLSDRDISAEYKDWAYSGSGALSMQGGKPALRKVAASILALAATRSGSATGHSGGQP